ncbi:MAG: hypothetical protein O3A00_01820 [Planctomycetota bacterium]|nr:hypothetical protein [Planctomycetota bacterium]
MSGSHNNIRSYEKAAAKRANRLIGEAFLIAKVELGAKTGRADRECPISIISQVSRANEADDGIGISANVGVRDLKSFLAIIDAIDNFLRRFERTHEQ